VEHRSLGPHRDAPCCEGARGSGIARPRSVDQDRP
jgi:hypothetical protein